MKPQLASPANLDTLTYPVFASPKLDGIRAVVFRGKLLSRTLKEIPSRHIFGMFSSPAFEGLDGELIVGPVTSPTCYRDTVSGVMADSKTPDFIYHVFDLWNSTDEFFERRKQLEDHDLAATHKHIRFVSHTMIEDRSQLDEYEAAQVALGHEGVMLNDPHALYKFGRATAIGGQLLKVKRFTDFESIVIGFEEEMFNGNEAETNELGRTKRSTAKEGLVGKNTLGALRVRDVKTDIEFKIGTGFSAAERQTYWADRESLIGKLAKYKSFEVGVKIAPRHPVFLGFRSNLDL
jgi:DNA ligase-1